MTIFRNPSKVSRSSCWKHLRNRLLILIWNLFIIKKYVARMLFIRFTIDYTFKRFFKFLCNLKIIKILKNSGTNVQILTKTCADAMRDFDLLDSNDWFGITYAGYNGDCGNPDYIPIEEKGAGSPHDRIYAINVAHKKGIKTWVSLEPVLNDLSVISLINLLGDVVDLWKIGKLNYHPSNIDWRAFGREAEAALIAKGRNYYIKESLREEMNK